MLSKFRMFSYSMLSPKYCCTLALQFFECRRPSSVGPISSVDQNTRLWSHFFGIYCLVDLQQGKVLEGWPWRNMDIA